MLLSKQRHFYLDGTQLQRYNVAEGRATAILQHCICTAVIHPVRNDVVCLTTHDVTFSQNS